MGFLDGLRQIAAQARPLPAEHPLVRQRVVTCQNCPYSFLPDFGYFVGEGSRRCKACGCFVHAKAKVPAFRCPLGRWP